MGGSGSRNGPVGEEGSKVNRSSNTGGIMGLSPPCIVVATAQQTPQRRALGTRTLAGRARYDHEGAVRRPAFFIASTDVMVNVNECTVS